MSFSQYVHCYIFCTFVLCVGDFTVQNAPKCGAECRLEFLSPRRLDVLDGEYMLSGMSYSAVGCEFIANESTNTLHMVSLRRNA